MKTYYLSDQRLRVHGEILRSLLYGDKTYYQLYKKEEIASNSIILEALGEMVEEELIVKGEPVGPRDKQPYSLTQYGLVFALKHFGKTEAGNLDKIAEVHKDKLDLFKIWNLLEEEGFTSEIKAKFRDQILNSTLAITKNLKPSDDIYLFTLLDHYRIYGKRDKLEKLLDVIKSNNELCTRFKEELKENIEDITQILKHYEGLFRYLD